MNGIELLKKNKLQLLPYVKQFSGNGTERLCPINEANLQRHFETLSNIPELIKNPAMVMESKKKGVLYCL